jgi:hypothetical protein
VVFSLRFLAPSIVIRTIPAPAKQHKEGLRQGKRKRKWKHIIDSAWRSHSSGIINPA